MARRRRATRATTPKKANQTKVKVEEKQTESNDAEKLLDTSFEDSVQEEGDHGDGILDSSAENIEQEKVDGEKLVAEDVQEVVSEEIEISTENSGVDEVVSKELELSTENSGVDQVVSEELEISTENSGVEVKCEQIQDDGDIVHSSAEIADHEMLDVHTETEADTDIMSEELEKSMTNTDVEMKLEDSVPEESDATIKASSDVLEGTENVDNEKLDSNKETTADVQEAVGKEVEKSAENITSDIPVVSEKNPEESKDKISASTLKNKWAASNDNIHLILNAMKKVTAEVGHVKTELPNKEGKDGENVGMDDGKESANQTEVDTDILADNAVYEIYEVVDAAEESTEADAHEDLTVNGEEEFVLLSEVADDNDGKKDKDRKADEGKDTSESTFILDDHLLFNQPGDIANKYFEAIQQEHYMKNLIMDITSLDVLASEELRSLLTQSIKCTVQIGQSKGGPKGTISVATDKLWKAEEIYKCLQSIDPKVKVRFDKTTVKRLPLKDQQFKKTLCLTKMSSDVTYRELNKLLPRKFVEKRIMLRNRDFTCEGTEFLHVKDEENMRQLTLQSKHGMDLLKARLRVSKAVTMANYTTSRGGELSFSKHAPMFVMKKTSDETVLCVDPSTGNRGIINNKYLWIFPDDTDARSNTTDQKSSTDSKKKNGHKEETKDVKVNKDEADRQKAKDANEKPEETKLEKSTDVKGKDEKEKSQTGPPKKAKKPVLLTELHKQLLTQLCKSKKFSSTQSPEFNILVTQLRNCQKPIPQDYEHYINFTTEHFSKFKKEVANAVWQKLFHHVLQVKVKDIPRKITNLSTNAGQGAGQRQGAGQGQGAGQRQGAGGNPWQPRQQKRVRSRNRNMNPQHPVPPYRPQGGPMRGGFGDYPRAPPGEYNMPPPDRFNMPGPGYSEPQTVNKAALSLLSGLAKALSMNKQQPQSSSQGSSDAGSFSSSSNPKSYGSSQDNPTSYKRKGPSEEPEIKSSEEKRGRYHEIPFDYN